MGNFMGFVADLWYQLMHRTTLVNCWGYRGDSSAIVNGVKKTTCHKGEPHRQVPGCRIPVLLRQRIANCDSHPSWQVEENIEENKFLSKFWEQLKKSELNAKTILRKTTKFHGDEMALFSHWNCMKLHEIGDSLLQFHLWLCLTSSHMDTRIPYVCIFSHQQIDRIV